MLTGDALLAGIGLTMSLFITTLAFIDAELLATARLAIIIGSFLSAIVGLVVLCQVNKIKERDENAI
ncbi:MAG: Na+/H+ antiporter NhaA [Piscirickettsiaceae bacterium]|nr:Na+/H+ antiporter NhaA [Piscirickettsiaceae bacterium]